MVGGQPRANFARLTADGTLDPGANPGPNNYVHGLALQADGKIVAVGDFTQIGSQSRSRIARLSLPEPTTQTLGYNGTTLTWQRGGASPEVGRTTFEFSTNLTTWSLLGTGPDRFTDSDSTNLGALLSGTVAVSRQTTGRANLEAAVQPRMDTDMKHFTQTTGPPGT